MTRADRERLTSEQVRRWPVFFGVQYFFTLLGVFTLCTYFANMVVAVPDTTAVGRNAVTAAIGALFFTLFIRWRSGRASTGSSAA